MAILDHLPIDEVLEHLFHSPWAHKSAPAIRHKRRRRARPQWAQTLFSNRDAQVIFDKPIACPSCGVLAKGLDGARGEIDDGGWLDVIQCSLCRAPVVLDLRIGTIRAPTESERRRWRLTFWFVVMREAQGD